MNGTMKYIIYIGAMLLILCGCSDEALVQKTNGEGTLLNIYASVNTGVNTRLAELGSAGNMFTDAKGKKNIGLYIYYEDDYSGKNSSDGKTPDLSKPYIRNLECTYSDGKIVPINPEGIYIYDRMTIVAFYPYNATMSDEANYFTVKADEKAYPISESDYSQQIYIPYRAETKVNPTNAYMINLGFGPQQTCKVEVVLVADKTDDFPESKDLTDGKIKLLPTVDRYEGTYDATTGDLRENWLDAIKDFPADDEYNQGTPQGGKYVRRYTAYVWKSGKDDKHHASHKHDNNILPNGEVLFESDKLILRVPAQVNLNEQTVYRYGYNMNTGEIFIPTSDKLVYDAASLQGVKFDEYRAYQVCDIDVRSIDNWTPKTAFKGTYDGGGHQITGLRMSVTPNANIDSKSPDKQSFGLFSQITSESTLMNIELVNPTITVDFSNTALTDTCYVGALCGLVNPELSEAQKRKMILDGLPPELSGPVKEALIQERLKDFAQTTCYIRGCKVTDPVITVTGENVRVGGLCGGAGNQKQKAEIKDSYVWQSDNATYQGILVNAASDEIKSKYNNTFVAGFCGILANSGEKGGITNCYNNLENVQAFVKDATTIATGFYNPATDKELLGTATVSSCYTLKADANPGVTNFTNGKPNKWPLFEKDETVTNGGVGVSNGINYPGAYPAYKWTDSWKDMDGNNSYPSLIWESRLLMPLN